MQERQQNSPDSDTERPGRRKMAEWVDTIACHTFTKEKQSQAMSELLYHQPSQPSQQDHASSYPQPTQGQGWGNAGKRTSRLIFFLPGWCRVEEIFDNRVIIEKHLHHTRDLFHNFIDFRKTFDRVWHASLWQVFRSFNIEEGLVQAIQALHEYSSSAVFLNS